MKKTILPKFQVTECFTNEIAPENGKGKLNNKKSVLWDLLDV